MSVRPFNFGELSPLHLALLCLNQGMGPLMRNKQSNRRVIQIMRRNLLSDSFAFMSCHAFSIVVLVLVPLAHQTIAVSFSQHIPRPLIRCADCEELLPYKETVSAGGARCVARRCKKMWSREATAGQGQWKSRMLRHNAAQCREAFPHQETVSHMNWWQ